MDRYERHMEAVMQMMGYREGDASGLILPSADNMFGGNGEESDGSGSDGVDEEVRWERNCKLVERFAKAVDEDRHWLTAAWANIQALPYHEAIKVSHDAILAPMWGEHCFPSRNMDNLFRAMRADPNLCPYKMFEPFMEFVLSSLATGQGIAEALPIEYFLGYARRVMPNAFDLFGYDIMEGCMEGDSGPNLYQLLQSTIAVPVSIEDTHLYVQAFQECCDEIPERRQCLMMFREHIQFDGNSKMITPEKLDRILRSNRGDVSNDCFRHIIQAGPALSPSWLLHMAVKSSMKKKPEYLNDDDSTAAQRDTWLLQRLLTPSGTPRPALRRALEAELQLRQGAIAGNAVAAAGGALAAGKVKTGADKHLVSADQEQGVVARVAVALAWFVRLAHQPNAHRAAYATLEQWRGRSDLAPGEVAALALFHAALAASPTGGYAYEALESPCDRPWWLFHVDLNVEHSDCFWEMSVDIAQLRIEKQAELPPLRSKVAQWLAEEGAGPSGPAGAAAAAAPPRGKGGTRGGVKRPRSSSRGGATSSNSGSSSSSSSSSAAPRGKTRASRPSSAAAASAAGGSAEPKAPPRRSARRR